MKRKIFVFVTLLVVVGSSSAEIFKCPIQGKIVYQEIPCQDGAKVNMSGAGKADPTSTYSLKQQRDAIDNARQSRIYNAILENKIVTGMTGDEVIRSWGKPSKINTTVSGSGTSEQWVYSREKIGTDQYVYLDNGIVRTIQSSK